MKLSEEIGLPVHPDMADAIKRNKLEQFVQWLKDNHLPFWGSQKDGEHTQ